MKQSVKLLLFSLCVLVISCKKYQEGPLVSFRSEKSRIIGLWKVDEIYLEGNDYTEVYKASKYYIDYIHITKDQTSVSSSKMYILVSDAYLKQDILASFVPNDNYTIVSVSGDIVYEPILNCEWTIVKLKKSQLWYKTVINNKKYEVRLIPYTY